MALVGEAPTIGSVSPPRAGHPPSPPGRRWRWLAWLGLSLPALLVLLLAGVTLLGHSLNHPWIKSRIVRLAKDSAGLGIDYAGLRVSLFDGVHARSLRIFTPQALAPGAETFLDVEDFALDAQLWSLAFGPRELKALRVGLIDVAVVADEAGRTTLSELFPAASEPAEPSPPSRLSQSLVQLPELSLRRLELGAIHARFVELGAGQPARVVALGPLHVEGSFESGAQGLAGSELRVSGAPGLRLELHETGGQLRQAELALQAVARATDPSTGALHVQLDMKDQNLAPGWAREAQLLALEATLHFDAASGQSSLELAQLSALGRRVSLAARARVFDAGVLRVEGGAEAAVHLAEWPPAGLPRAALPAALGSLAFGSFDLDASGSDLSWQGEQVRGALEWRGRVRGLQLAEGELRARLPDARLEGAATFAGRQGSFRTELGASPAVQLPQLSAEFEDLALQVTGSITPREGQAPGALELRAQSRVTLAAGQLRTDTGGALTLAGLSLEHDVSAVLADLTQPVLPTLEAHLALRRLEASGRQGRAQLERLKLGVSAQQPRPWAPDGDSDGRASVTASIEQAQAGAYRGKLDELRLSAERLDTERYRVELGAVASSLVARGRKLGGRLGTELRAELAPAAGTAALTAQVRGPRAARADLELSAQFDRASERLAYRAGLRARQLAPFVTLAAAAVPNLPRFSLAAARFNATAQGELSGLLHQGAGPLPELAKDPLRSLQGRQALGVEVAGLDYRAPDRLLESSLLAIDVESTHRRGGAGHTQTKLRAKTLRYEGDGKALRLEGFDQKLTAKFDRLPQYGTTNIVSTIEIASAVQSWLPGYPVRDFRCTSELDVERLLSVYLRDIAIDNPGAGSSLRASGALELRAQGSAAVTGSKTLVGREALSFEGRLDQVLEPLQKAGAARRAVGTIALPFRLESGGLIGYRFLATLEADQVSFVTNDGSFLVERLNGVIPILEEVVILPGGVVMGSDPRASPLSDARFFDVQPFLGGNNYVTADLIRAGGLPTFGPLAANLRLERTGLLVDQLQVGYGGGQIVGQARIAYRGGNPIVRLRLNATGLRSTRTDEVLDANATLSFEPVALTLNGKLQLVRASSGHVLDLLDLLDPFRESANANRVRSALAIGYPKYVRFQLHDGTVDAKIELGGIAQLVRLDEIKAMPLGPVLQKYVAPAFAGLLPPPPPRNPAPTAQATAQSSAAPAARPAPALKVPARTAPALAPGAADRRATRDP